jgi:hypothetical protein
MTPYLCTKYLSVWIVFLIGISGLVTPAFSKCETQHISPRIREYLLKEFPDWKVVGVNDLLAYHKELWVAEHGAECPGVAFGRYEPTGRWRTAMLIIPKSSTDLRAKLLLIGETGGRYNHKILADISQRGPTPVLFKAPPGKYRSWNGSRTVRTRYPVMSLVFYESSATVFFWANGKFRELQVSD